MPSPIPQDSEHRLHVAITIVAALLAVAMVAAAAWALTRPRPGATIRAAITPAEETSAAATATFSADATGSAGAVTTSSAGASTDETESPGSSATTKKPRYRLAYHNGSAFYVATEDAKSSAIVHVTSVSYALSPDGHSVAAVEGGKLLVTSVGQHTSASSPVLPGLPADNVVPVWMPDSSAVLFIRPDSAGVPYVWRFTLETSAAAQVCLGSGVAVSPDGHTIVAMPTGDSSALVVWTDTGKARSVSVPSGDPVAVALGNDRLFVSTVSVAGDSGLWSLAMDGSDKRRLAYTGASDDMSATFGELLLSPDGSKLLYAADGDDGYSRLRVVPTAGGDPVKISGRRDGYAIRWSPGGKRIYFVEGNAYQGQATSLCYISPNGRGRTVLVAGAGI